METDYHLLIPVESLEDEEKLGTLLENALRILAEIPKENTPGPRSGYIGIEFQAGDASLYLWFPEENARDALFERNLRGAALLHALK